MIEWIRKLKDDVKEINEKLGRQQSALEKQEIRKEEIYADLKEQIKRLELIETKLSCVDGLEQQLARVEFLCGNIAMGVDSLNKMVRYFQSNWQMETMGRYEDINSCKQAEHIRKMHSLLTVKDIDSKSGKLYRTGKDDDGGYLMLDKFVEKKIAYSFGISDDVSWDKSMADMGFDVYMYDHTIEGLPEENPKFHWEKIGLTDKYDEKNPCLHTLPQILIDNGHNDNEHMILKIDIEGAEWDSLASLPIKYFKKFDQIVMEFHDLNKMENFDVMEMAFSNLNKNHQLVHVHANNHENYLMISGKLLPNVIECTYINREVCDFVQHEGVFPSALDNANNKYCPDIFLGKWS